MEITGNVLNPVNRGPVEESKNSSMEVDRSPEKKQCIETAAKVEASIQKVSQEREKSPIDLFIELLEKKRSQIDLTSPEEKNAWKVKFGQAQKELSLSKEKKEENFNTLLSCLKKTDGIAEINLGKYYLYGIIVERNLHRAFDLFLDGAVQLKISCQIYLVYMFSLKEFEHFSLEKAQYCCNLVKKGGAIESLNKMVSFFLNEKPQFINLNFIYLVANALLKTHYRASALFYLWFVEEKGCDFCLQNKKEGLVKLKNSANLGNIDAILFLARDLAKAPDTLIEAINIYKIGIKQDHFIAKYEAAELLSLIDQKTAIELFEEISIDISATKEQRTKALDYLNSKYISDILMRKFFQRAKKALIKYPQEKDHLFLIGKEIFSLVTSKYSFKGYQLMRKATELGSIEARNYFDRPLKNNENTEPSSSALVAEETEARIEL